MDDHVDQLVHQWSRERPDLPLTGVGVQARVKLLSKQFQRETDLALEPFELGPWGWEILAALRRQGRPFHASPGRLGADTGITSGSITNRLDRLEKRGLIERKADPKDRRGVLVVLTDHGLDLVERAARARFQVAENRMDPLSTAERETLESLLRRLLAQDDGARARMTPEDGR
jgi:DNA-binding MarR family transcriptional regulator